jgi:hypothetical protein
MSYSESEGVAKFFSYDRGELMEFNSQLREKLDESGGQYEGPWTLPNVDADTVDWFLLYISHPDSGDWDWGSGFPNWLFEVAKNGESREILLEASKSDNGFYARGYNLIGNRAIKTAFSLEPPSSIGVIAELGQRTHGKGGDRPVTWNPNVDHIPSHPDGPW